MKTGYRETAQLTEGEQFKLMKPLKEIVTLR